MTTRLAVAVSLLAVPLFSSCGGGSSDPDAVTVCGDGADNDGDGLADYPADPGCDSPGDLDEGNAPIAQCMDGRDNDGDGKTDHPEDPGCMTSVQNDETDDCPSGPTCPECGNGVDDDGDGGTDYPFDVGCIAAGDDSEHLTDANACGSNVTVLPLLTDEVEGELVAGGGSDLVASCGGAGDELVYELLLQEPAVIVATTAGSGTTVTNTVLSLRTDCIDAGSELACNDDLGPGNQRSEITASLRAGVYYLIVDSHMAGVTGDLALRIERFPGFGTPCTTVDDCGPGLECRVPHGESAMVCVEPVCSDHIDDDGDARVDFPHDPGCTSRTDGTEADSCPSGADCPACGNGVDDDGDTQTDYPADVDCDSASQLIEGCSIERDPFVAITSGTTTGTLAGAYDDFTLSCASIHTSDVTHVVTLPAMETITFDTNTTLFDTVLGLYPPACSTYIECDDDDGEGTQSLITRTNLAAGTYAVVVAAYGTPGPYTLHASGTIATGGRCDGPLAMSGAITCGTGMTCTGGRCVGDRACNNGVDDDGDGHAGYPEDPGCLTPTDNTEADTCPSGGTCPDCANGQDDDGDGATDYPDDLLCSAASDNREGCDTSEAIVVLNAPSITSSNTTATDDILLPCGGTTGGGLDRIYQIDLPATTTVTFTAEPNTFDAVVALYDATCGGTPIACSDTPETLTRTNLAGGRYYFIVDGWVASSTGSYPVGVTGSIASGASCEGPLVAPGGLQCAAGTTCQGPSGSRTCEP